MANTVISPNMNMPVPVVGTDPGPDWATNLNACLSIVDSHNHTSGQGVPITPEAIDINEDLPFSGNNATTLRSVRFTPQSGTITGASDLGCLYENGVDLYYVDGAGNQVRITQGGSVTGASGTITGLPSGTASAAFAGSTFTFQSATNTPATMNVGTVILGQTVASGKTVTIAASGSQASNYNLTLPIALPASQSTVVSDTSGNLSFTPILVTTYAPSVSAASGGTGFSASSFMVLRVGNIVKISGSISFAPNASFASCVLSIPVSRTDGNFTTIYQASGVTGRASSEPTGQAGEVLANSGDQTLTATIGTTGGSLSGEFRVEATYSLVNF